MCFFCLCFTAVTVFLCLWLLHVSVYVCVCVYWLCLSACLSVWASMSACLCLWAVVVQKKWMSAATHVGVFVFHKKRTSVRWLGDTVRLKQQVPTRPIQFHLETSSLEKWANHYTVMMEVFTSWILPSIEWYVSVFHLKEPWVASEKCPAIFMGEIYQYTVLS